MKKTSKKLLSFFLAVVMIVTSCSVGLTAFAADKNPVDKYWNDSTSASEAFDKLNSLVDAYVPMIMGIEINGETLGSLLGMSEEEAETASLSKVVSAASPLLLGLLGANGNKQKILKAANGLGDDDAYPKRFDLYYSYLNGSEDDAMSFYDLYQFCSDNATSKNSELAEWCTNTKATLDTLIAVVGAADASYSTSKNDADKAYQAILTAYNKVSGVVKTNNGPTIEAIANTTINTTYKNKAGKTIAISGKIGELNNDDIKYGIETCNGALKASGATLTATNAAEALVYYYFGCQSTQLYTYSDASSALAFLLNYLKYAELAGDPITTKNLGEASPRPLTVDNYDEVLGSLLATYPGSKDDANKADKKYYYYQKMITAAIMDCVTLDAKGWVKTADIRYDAYASSKREAIEIGALLESGFLGDNVDDIKKLINDNKITKDKLTKLRKVLIDNEWVKAVEDSEGNVEYTAEPTDIAAFLKTEEASKMLGEHAATLLATRYFGTIDDIGIKFAIKLGSGADAAMAHIVENPSNLSNVKQEMTRITLIGGGESISFVEYFNRIICGYVAQKVANSATPISGTVIYSHPRIDTIEFRKYYDAIKPAIDKAGAKYEYKGDLVIPGKFSVDAVNSALNSTLDNILGMDLVKGAVDGLLETQGVDLQAITHDLWKNLYDNPVSTIFNLIPVLVILIDEVIVPIVFNNNDTDQYAGILYSFLCTGEGILADKTIEAGDTSVGISALSFDLNKVIPSILYWFSATATDDEDVAETYRRKVYKQVGFYNEAGTGKISHGGIDYNIPKFTGIYVADKAIAGVWLNPNLARTIYCSMTGEDKEKTTFGTKKADKDTQNLANGLVEVIAEIVNFAREGVDEYLKDHADDIRYSAHEKTATQSGLNNVFVALPQLIDIIGKKFINKYGVKSDWTYLYGNKIEKKEKTFSDGTVEQTYNNTLEDFKALVFENKADMVLESFVDVLIGNWVNSLLDFLNDTLSTDNKITNKFALVKGLLDALGGLGQKSIITDVLNGFFDLKRSDAASFTLKKQSGTNFVGFSTKSGLFLLSNLQFEDNGTSKGIIPLIINVVNGAKTSAVSNALASAARGTTTTMSPLASAVAPLAGAKLGATNSDDLLTSENLKAAQGLIDKLDAVLKSLLQNTSINGFTLTSNDNILAGVISAVSYYIGASNTNAIIDLLDEYLNVLTIKPVNGKVDANKVYTSKNLSKLVIKTYGLVESIVDYLFYNETSGLLKAGDDYKVITGAITGIISPDSIAVRMTSKYSKTAGILAKYHNWTEIGASTDLKFDMKDGSKTGFYDGLGQSLSSIAAILSAVLAKSYTDNTKTKNYYSEVIYPVFNAIATKVDAKGVMKPAAFNKATAQDQLIKGVITPLSNILSKIYDAPATFILELVSALGGLLNDKALTGIVSGLTAPINALLDGLKTFVGSKDAGLNAPSLKAYLKGLIPTLKIDLPYKKNIIVNVLNNISIDDSQKLKDIVKIPNIDWNKLYKADAKTTLLLVFGFAVDTLLQSKLVGDALKGVNKDLYKLVVGLDAASILKIVGGVLDCVQSPTQAYWTFKHYSPKKDGPISRNFSYPAGILPQDATNAITNLDTMVANIFPLLQQLGVADIESLSGLVNDKLYTNEILTTISTALYGAVYDKLILENGLTEIFVALGLDLSPKGLAAFLTDKSYGNTYSDAAATLKKAKKWSKVKSINWGFKNGSANAQKGFINGLAAMLRPFNNILAILVADNAGFGPIGLEDDTIKTVVDAIKELSVDTDIPVAEDSDAGANLKLTIKDGVLKLVVDSKMSKQNSVVKCDLAKVVKTLLEQLKDAKINLGTNGYESAIVPILEAFMCKNVKTYAQYKADYKKAKDNLLIDVLNPIFGLVNDVLEAPIDTVTKILPNVAYFIDNNGLAQAVGNLLAPVTAKNGLIGVLADNGINVDDLIKTFAGKDLGTIITDAIGINVKLNMQLTDLANCNIQDIVLPLVKKLLKDNKIDISIPDFTFKALYSHGTLKTVKSAAKNAEGAYTTKRIVANQGEVLVAVLRYVATVLVKNAPALNKLISGIDAIKKNATLKNIIGAVFGQIRTATPDQIVAAILKLVDEIYSEDKFFDYSGFEYKDYEFSFGDMDEDFCRKLAPMLDGLVNGLLADKGGLNGLIGDLLYKDDLISKIATGLYGAVDGVKLNDSLGLTALLAQLDIDFSTANVAALLTDESYGQTYEANARIIKNAGKWSNVKAESLHWGVKDRDTFVHALCAVLRPVYGVLDVLLNNGSLNIFNIISIPGSDGYTSTFVPLMEAFGLYNIKTQYQYRQDIYEEYDAILLDILNPLLDKVEDILNAPIEMVADILPNLSLFFANDGLLQLIDNLLAPVSALISAINPVVDLNAIIDALNLDINGLLGKIGIKADVKIDVYDLKSTLEPLIGAENVVSLLNGILSIIKIKGTPLGLELPEIDWFQLASHGEYVLNAESQAATIGGRIAVKADQDETLIAVLRYLINTINYKDNYNKIVDLLGGLLGGMSDTVAGVIDQVLGMLQGDADEVITKLVDLLQSIAG